MEGWFGDFDTPRDRKSGVAAAKPAAAPTATAPTAPAAGDPARSIITAKEARTIKAPRLKL